MPRVFITLIALIAAMFSIAVAAAQELDDAYAGVHKSRTADGAFVLGDPDAAVKLIEFSDFLCTSCQNYEPVIAGFVGEFVLSGRAQLEYRFFPVIDPVLSPLSASLVECADTLSDGSFWRAHDAMFNMVSSEGFTLQSSSAFAQIMKLDEGALLECAAAATQYQIDQAYGFDMNVNGTPSLFVKFGNDEPIALSLPLPEHFDVIANAVRPANNDPVTIESGPYAGMTAFRRRDGGFVLGSPDAPLTIVTFEDFLCPHCQSYQSTVRDFIDKHVRTGEAQFEFRFYPLVSPQFSVASAQIAECIGWQDLDKFWDAHDLLFEFATTGVIGDDAARSVANLMDIDLDELNSCRNGAMQYLIDTQVAQQHGVSGTPAIRARQDGGPPQVIFAGQQPMDRGGAPIEVLTALASGSPDASIGPSERSMLSDRLLADTSLISGEPCASPCWQNITPGETRYEDALARVDELEGLAIVQADDQAIVFAVSDGDACCQIYSDDSGIVSMILLQLSPQMRLRELLELHGDPSYVIGQPFSDAEAMLILIYPERASLVYTMVAGEEGSLQETSPIVATLYMTQRQANLLIASTPLDNWKGLLTYSEYMDGEFDQVP